MADENIIKAVNEVFIEDFEIPEEKILPESHIFEDIGLDSLDIVDLVVALQKKFGVSIREDERVREIRTMQDLYDYISALKEEQKI